MEFKRYPSQLSGFHSVVSNSRFQVMNQEHVRQTSIDISYVRVVHMIT